MRRLVYPGMSPFAAFVCLGVLLSTISPLCRVDAQQAPLAGVSTAASFLAQVALKYPGAVSLSSVALNATAQWSLGSQKETGTAVLQAKPDGTSSMQLILSKATRTEARKALGDARSCLWSDAAGTHQVNDVDCNAPVNWFAPFLSIQPATSVLPLLNIVDDGLVTTESGTFRQISYRLPMHGNQSTLTDPLTSGTRVSVLYDPQTLLPSSVEYMQHADSDLNTTFPVRVAYSSYQLVQGVPVPYQIDRYVSNVLQLSLTVTHASLN